MGRSRRSTTETGTRYRNRRQTGPAARRRMAIVFAATLGCFGVHRFTLGQWQLGLFHIFLMVVSLSLLENTFLGITPWLTLSGFLGYGTALWWWRMSDDEFADRYLEVEEEPAPSSKYLQGTKAVHPKVKSRRERRKVLASAKTSYDQYDFAQAAKLYEEALDLDLSDGESRVLAARCYSLLEDADGAYRNLRRAVQLKADNLSLVDSDEGFAWLRTRPTFMARKRGGYTAVTEEVAPLPELPQASDNILDRLDQLGRLKERGLLDEQEFVREKRKLLR